ncbi:hypothetical protein PMIN01_13518 [Paraphaeosphaeria minitans]|uniref:Uncharacterized protein n=1 Tax=Paraphaeosphaeria minitans TaxID=565426 RepID=A0A9P6G4Q0_9PLEO|nr:hypothetical protein PMIN01_13518 [Paraphaeosphaeria minitans]
MPKASKTKTDPNLKGKSPKRSIQKDSPSRPDDAPFPIADFSSFATVLAKSATYRLVRDGFDGEEEYFVLHEDDPIMQTLMDTDDVVVKFDPPENKTLLKNAGYDKVIDQKVRYYGKGGKYTLFIFRLKKGKVLWMTRSSFTSALGKEKADKFEEDAKKLRVGHAATSDGNDVGEGPSRSGGITAVSDIKREIDVGSDEEGAAKTDAGSNVDNEEESETLSKVESTVESETESDTVPQSDDDDDDTPVSSVPVSKDKTRRSTTPQVNGRSSIYAREVDGKWQTIMQKDGLYDMKEKENPPQNCRHSEEKTGYAPSADRDFITGILLRARGKGLDVTKFELLGCVGFKRGRGAVWKAAILKLTDQNLKKQLQSVRTEAECTYTGPLLLSWTQFQKVFRSYKKRAEQLFDKTTLGKALKEEMKACEAEGKPFRRARHETFEPDALKPLYDKMDAIMRAISGLSMKSKL